jgi:hypothetical protein
MGHGPNECKLGQADDDARKAKPLGLAIGDRAEAGGLEEFGRRTPRT